jgi:hypothetical protein
MRLLEIMFKNILNAFLPQPLKGEGIENYHTLKGKGK